LLNINATVLSCRLFSPHEDEDEDEDEEEDDAREGPSWRL
jgi:hypothetical protein